MGHKQERYISIVKPQCKNHAKNVYVLELHVLIVESMFAFFTLHECNILI